MATELRRGYCALCISRCGCIGTVVDGVLTRVDPDPDHPTGAALCIKGKAAPEMVYAPERILHPLRRTRPKGDPDPGWERITWEEALDLLAARMRAARPQGLAFAVATPSGTALADGFAWLHRLAHACHSPNLVFATENCNWHKDHAPATTFGAGIGMPDYANTGCILLWGFNPATSWPAQASAIQQARKRGARLIVVDPRRAGLANSADLWLRPRPGSDGALALGLAHLLIESARFDRAFLAQWSDAPFLVAEESGRLLNGADLAADGDPARSLAWDEDIGHARTCPQRPPNAGAHAQLALRGRFLVGTRNGPSVCRPVFDLLAERCAAWTPDRVAAATGIPAEQVVAAAYLIAANLPLSFYTWTGTAQHGNATRTGRAIAALYGLTGCLDAPGGNVWFSKPPLADVAGFEWVDREERAQTLGHRERPLGPAQNGWITSRDLFRAIVTGEPYPVSCLVAFGGNFLQSKPNTRHTEAALERLDFFALAELVETPSARYADLLLPVSTAWEREGLQAGFQVSAAAEARVQLRPALVAPQGESRSDTWIAFQLARRLDLADQFFGGDLEAALAAQLAPSGLTPERLRAAPGGLDLDLATRYRKYRQDGFATPSRRLEFHSRRLMEAGLDPLPGQVAPVGAPPFAKGGGGGFSQGSSKCCGPQIPPNPCFSNGETLASLLSDNRAVEKTGARFPLILTTAKWPQYCHSQQRHLPSLRRRMPEPLVEIHPDTAQRRGIREGDWVEVATRLGALRARARLDRHLAPEVVCAQYGWWQYPDGAGDANRLIDGECFDPVSGSNCLRNFPCQVRALPA